LREGRKGESFLERQLAEYEKCPYNLPGAFKEEISDLKRELKSLIETKLEGIMIRSRAEIIKGLDQPSSFFLRREQQNRKDKLIKKLIVDNTDINTKDGILTACYNYYKRLLTAEPIDTDLIDYFTQNLVNLETPNRNLCEGHITKDEVWDAVHSLKTIKVPAQTDSRNNIILIIYHIS